MDFYRARNHTLIHYRCMAILSFKFTLRLSFHRLVKTKDQPKQKISVVRDAQRH